MEYLAAIFGAIAASLGAIVFWLARRAGQKEAQLDEAKRDTQRSDDEIRRINEAIAQRRDADEIARTIADVRTDPSMRDRERK